MTAIASVNPLLPVLRDGGPLQKKGTTRSQVGGTKSSSMTLTLATPTPTFSKVLPLRTKSVNDGERRSLNASLSKRESLVGTADVPSLARSMPSGSFKKLTGRSLNRMSFTNTSQNSQPDESHGKRKRIKSKLTSKFSFASSLLRPQIKPKIKRQDGLTPLQRFKKAARLVKLLVTVSNACRDLLVYAIKDEGWYEHCEKILLDASAGGSQGTTDLFTRTFKDPITKKFEQLEFDKSLFKRDYHQGSSLLTQEIKDILCKRPGTRTAKEIEDCVHCLKHLVSAFRSYTYMQQKRICQCAMYDRYFQERVVLREKLPPDGVYFVLNGTLIEKGEKMKHPRTIKPGEKFGEEDLKNGVQRQSNVITKSAVDLLYLHKLDYEEIFELTVDLSGRESDVFDVCKNDMLLRSFPWDTLLKNPGTWRVLRYKYGRLIAVNSCETDFIYIIRSGEARVLKCLETQSINVLQRRRQLQSELDSQDPFVKKKRLLDFVSDNSLRPTYSFNAFGAQNLGAEILPIEERIKYLSALPNSSKQNKEDSSIAMSPLEPDVISIDGSPYLKLQSETEEFGLEVVTIATIAEATRFPNAKKLEKMRAMTAPNSQSLPIMPKRPHTTKPLLKMDDESSDIYRRRKASKSKPVPPFVQVGALTSGNTFGLRTLLSSKEQEDEPVALVSAGCEVIQINRRFFAKHLDAHMLGIVSLKSKPHPTEEELLKRLDVNLQWEEYCAEVMCDYLDSKRKTTPA